MARPRTRHHRRLALRCTETEGVTVPDTAHLLVFIVSGWLLNLTPGPDVLYILSHAMRTGLRAGVVAAMGIVAGCFVHVVAAALGVSALLATSAAAFVVLKWVGAAYLVWMGVRMLLVRQGETPPANMAGRTVEQTNAMPLRQVFLRGFLTNVLNPKVALFFLAFVPQFIAPQSTDKAWTFLMLGLLFNINSLPINLGYAWVGSFAVRRVQSVQRGMRWLDRLAGLMFIGFGVKLALSQHPTP
jgi:threonine/homoserine/homoserine lactone efflux protein